MSSSGLTLSDATSGISPTTLKGPKLIAPETFLPTDTQTIRTDYPDYHVQPVAIKDYYYYYYYIYIYIYIYMYIYIYISIYINIYIYYSYVYIYIYIYIYTMYIQCIYVQ